LLFVAIFGPGVVAGILAIAFRSIGFTGKLMAEAIEEIDRRPNEAITAAGGIDLILQGSMDTFQWRTASTILIAILAVVVLGELIGGVLRRRVL
jgi:phosphonate transport system permease protein